MSIIYKPKRSTTALKVPTASDLQDGELGVNIADGIIYINDGGSIVAVSNVSTGMGISNAPYEVLDGEVFTVPERAQVPYSQPIEMQGSAMLDLTGLLVEVS